MILADKKLGWFARVNWALIAIVGLGLGLRMWAIGFGLPYMVHPDEGEPVTIALRILHTGNLNPGFFHWSSLLFYLNAALYFALFIVGRLTGRFASPGDLPLPDVEAIAVGKTNLPELFLLSRGLSAIVGVLSIVIVYLIVRDMISDRRAAWLAALLLAVESIDVKNSQYIRPDTFVVFFELLTVLFTLKILSDPRLRYYLLAGISVGLATSFKYNAVVVFLPILVAHGFCFGRRGIFRKEIYLAALCSVVAFLLTTPYALLDLPEFLAIGPLQAASIYATGHTGAEGDTIAWYIQFLWQTQGWILLLALSGALVILLRRDRKGFVLLVFPTAYYALINLYVVHFDETALPVIPFLLILAALFLARLFAFLPSRGDFQHAVKGVAWVGLAMVLVFPPLQATLQNNVRLLQPDGRDQAREWIDANLTPGSRIALEAYAPYVERGRFTVEGVDFTAHPPEWFEENGFEYLVFSYGSYGRFYENPTQYQDFVNHYNTLFSEFQLVARFDENNYEVRIYKTNTTMVPSNRVAARFGIYSNWLELVGYDLKPAQAGKSLQITFNWRVLEPRREALTLTVRLLDRDDHEIAQSSGALFGDARPVDGIVRVPWTVGAPVEPGLYHLELDVDAEGQGRIPVLARDYAKISDKLFVGPFKVAPPIISADEVQRARPSNARFSDAITLLGDSIPDRVARAGETLPVTLYWQSRAKIAKDYTVFLHLLDSSGNLRAQLDAQPRGGTYPTSIWDAGEIVRDDYMLMLPSDLAPGEYNLELGLYEYPNLARLPVADAEGKNLGDRLLLNDTIKVTR